MNTRGMFTEEILNGKVFVQYVFEIDNIIVILILTDKIITKICLTQEVFPGIY